MTRNIDITKINGHPDNPRKDLGDLTELAESIKSNGILQNLTIVPQDTETYQKQLAGKKAYTGEFIAIIGHRRLAAAKLAGLTEVPCEIVDMDMKTQISTMLLENMQRNDLTVWEQANGFQMMLDLGSTIGDIAQKTGLSETTVRRRTKLLDLEKDNFKAAVDRGATLSDFAELDKINDSELKNKVLKDIGTNNFNYSLQCAISKEKLAFAKAELLKKLNTFAVEVDSRNDYSYVRYLDFSYTNFEVPKDASELKYFYCDEGTYIELLTEKKELTLEETPANKESRRLEGVRSQLSEIKDRAFQLRKNFIKNYSVADAKKNINLIMEFVSRSMLDGGYGCELDEDMFMEILEIELGEDEELSFDKITETFQASPTKVTLIAAYCNYSDSERISYYAWSCKYKTNSDLDKLYTILTNLGYEMSDEEKAMADGTHKLYEAEENRKGDC